MGLGWSLCSADVSYFSAEIASDSGIASGGPVGRCQRGLPRKISTMIRLEGLVFKGVPSAGLGLH